MPLSLRQVSGVEARGREALKQWDDHGTVFAKESS